MYNIIQNTKILEERMIKQLLWYFEFLSLEQKKVLEEFFLCEKKLILNFLRGLKDKWELSFVQIKDSIDRTMRQKNLFIEMQDEKNKNKELESLLNNL